MKRLALVMGKQGSGKSSRVFVELQRHFSLRLRWRAWLPACARIELRPNYYNHIARSAAGEAQFILSFHRGRGAHLVSDRLRAGRTALEFPHSAYIPAEIDRHFNRPGLATRIFVLMLPEAIWRSYEGRVARITSPEAFMRDGPEIVERAAIDYAAECERIRADVRASGIPATFHPSADDLARAVIRFLA